MGKANAAAVKPANWENLRYIGTIGARQSSAAAGRQITEVATFSSGTSFGAGYAARKARTRLWCAYRRP